MIPGTCWAGFESIYYWEKSKFANSNYYQTRCSRGCSTNTFVINSVSESAFSSKSPKYHKSQIVRAGELKFWENVSPHNIWHVTCHVSRVTCHVSQDMCHMSIFYYLSFFPRTKWWSLSVEGLLSTGPTPSSLIGGTCNEINKDISQR